jgi:hypothetical protein
MDAEKAGIIGYMIFTGTLLVGTICGVGYTVLTQGIPNLDTSPAQGAQGQAQRPTVTINGTTYRCVLPLEAGRPSAPARRARPAEARPL